MTLKRPLSPGDVPHAMGELKQKSAKTFPYVTPQFPVVFRLEDLNIDAVECIVKHLSLSDIHNFRLAGMGASSKTIHSSLYREVRFRVAELQIIWQVMTYVDIRCSLWTYARSYDSYKDPCQCAVIPTSGIFDPTTLPLPSTVSASEGIYMSSVNGAVCKALANNMPQLRTLSVAYPRSPQSEFKWHQLDTLPDELGLCQNLQALDISGHLFVDFPEAVLCLSKLTRLSLSRNTELAFLPEDIGLRLPLLASIELEDTGLDRLPRSLLHCLERNMRDEIVNDHVRLAGTPLTMAYLHTAVNAREFPTLRALITKRRSPL